MKNGLLIICTTLLLPLLSFAQDTPVPADSVPPKVKYWKLRLLFGANGTQTSFVNWSAGGRNNISILGYVSGSAEYKKDAWMWKSNMDLALGGLRYMDSLGRRQGLQKTDDKIDLATNLGYKIKDKWFVSLVGGFKTQFLDGFNYPNDSTRVSSFMAPGYINLAAGIDYTPNSNLSVFLSPIATKMTLVNDKELADQGAFGVQNATFNSAGHVVSAGKRFRGEFGAYFKLLYQKEIFKNVNFKGRLELFSNYAEKPQNIDVNADILWTFKVNNWLSASLNWTLIYDDDIKVRDAKGGFGPRTQFKSVLGLGLSYTVKNFKEAK